MIGGDWIVPQREQAFREHAWADVEMMALADDVSHLLCELIERFKVAPADGDASADDVRRHALWFMAIIAFRALRAAMNTFAIGYEDQAVGFSRLLDEVHNRAQAVHGDASGKEARAWLAGRNYGKGAKLAGREFWDYLSGPVHANVRAVLDWLTITQPDGSNEVKLGPERRPTVANATLTLMASETRDIANLLALHFGVRLDLRALDSKIHAAKGKYIPEDE